ncbi:MAG: hypothetical protein HUK16_05075 [Bacteroidales bacterium]|nr:hypothetical protein [Bacteroidales bacterium]
MIKRLLNFKEKHPFTALLLAAIVVRTLVVIFFPGYGSHAEMQRPSLILALVQKFNGWTHGVIGNEPIIMFLSRCFYATLSLLTVSMIYRIADLLSNKKTAWLIAIIPMIGIVMPAFGIISSINAFIGTPFLLYGLMVILRQEVLRANNLNENVHRTSYLFAGLSLGLASCIWYPCFLLIISILIILICLRNLKGALSTFLGAFITFSVIAILMLLLGINPWPYLYL